MKKIDHINISVLFDAATLTQDETVLFYADYSVSDLQDPKVKKHHKIDLTHHKDLLQKLILEATSAINELEGTAYDQDSRPLEKPLTEEEYVALDVAKKRIREYPSAHAYIEAMYDARQGDDTKLKALDKQVALVKAKYPKPTQVRPSVWARIKAFFGF